MAYKDMTPMERVTAIHIDFARDPEFCLMAGTCLVGKVTIDPAMPTAATDGENCFYGEKYIMGLSREELRYEVAHENMHKAMRHCLDYKAIVEKHGQVTNAAMDVVVDWAIETMNKGRTFAKRPAWLPPITTHDKYKDWSWLEVLRDMLQNPPPQKQQQGGGGKPGEGAPGTGSRDEHRPGTAKTEAQAKELAKQIQDAINQGAVMQSKIRGTGVGGAALSGFQERKTDWRTPLRKFITELCEGDEFNRMNPPNRRMQAAGYLMPSHFSESTGILLVAVDTSGSMGSVIGVLLGEIARICQQCQPAEVRVVFWDSEICATQKFTQKDYAQIGKLLKPEGGGGTTLSVVADWVAQEKLKVKATIILTDTYFEGNPRLVPGPILWGVLDRNGWKPPRGKAIYLSSLEM